MVHKMFWSTVKSESLVTYKKDQSQRSIFSPPSPSPLSVLPATPPPYHFHNSPSRARPNRNTFKVHFPYPLQLQQAFTDQIHGMLQRFSHLCIWTSLIYIV
jgi:hypothetical protein